MCVFFCVCFWMNVNDRFRSLYDCTTTAPLNHIPRDVTRDHVFVSPRLHLQLRVVVTVATVVCIDTARTRHRVRDLEVRPRGTAVVVASLVLPRNDDRYNSGNNGHNTDSSTDTDTSLGTGSQAGCSSRSRAAGAGGSLYLRLASCHSGSLGGMVSRLTLAGEPVVALVVVGAGAVVD